MISLWFPRLVCLAIFGPTCPHQILREDRRLKLASRRVSSGPDGEDQSCETGMLPDVRKNEPTAERVVVCVCVSHSVSKRFYTQGGREDLQGSAQRSSLQDPRKRKLITSVYLHLLNYGNSKPPGIRRITPHNPPPRRVLYSPPN